MSWIEKLYKTYEQGLEVSRSSEYPLMPVGHTTQQAHIEVTIDPDGRFVTATVVQKEKATTMVPCTEASGGRAGSKPVNHPLCDKLQYVAADFVAKGGVVTSGFAKDVEQPHREYVSSLTQWEASAHSHPKLKAILTYARSGNVVQDLINVGQLHVGPEGKLLGPWEPTSSDKAAKPAIYDSPIFKLIVDQRDAFVRWRVESPGATGTGTWEDDGLVRAWTAYQASQQTKRGLCMVTGEETILAEQHPAKLRNAGDKAKLISANDSSGFTYRGRFTDPDQACGVGFEVTQKAHSALRWLLDGRRKQAFRNGDQVVVTWAVNGSPVPDPLESTFAFLGLEESDTTLAHMYHGDAGQALGKRFSKRMAGYQSAIGNLDDIVVMGVDSATPGRMAITYYRELHGSELLARVERWHKTFSWYQNYSPSIKFVGAPSPRDIAEAAYGRRLDDKLKKATVERLLPCIIDGQPVPRDLVESTIRRVCNRVGLEHWEWLKCLGIACALYRGTHESEHFKLTLDMERDTRDYLYGRLLAIAEHIEINALYAAGEKARDTSAEKLMHRFATRPYSTWTQIELNLRPYLSRLKSKWPGFHRNMLRLTSEVTAQLGDRYTDDSRLSGEFLLGYHCQWLELNPPKELRKAEEEQELTETTEQTTNP
jgi:CRISPR-associated protein Csd1